MSTCQKTEATQRIDDRIGRRIFMARQARSLSQSALAGRLGVSFQQVQKYECGANRVSAARLYQIARALDWPVEWFFEAVDGAGADPVDAEGVERFLAIPRVRELAELWQTLAPGARSTVLAMLRLMGEGERRAAAARG